MDYCKDCAVGLYNTKHHNIQGVGNPWNGICIVVPNVDYGAYKLGDMSFSSQVEQIKSVLSSSTGDLLSNLYIVPLIRCNETISCALDNITYNRCIHWFAEDVRKFQFKDILLLGTAAKRFLNCNITNYLNSIIISRNNKRYAVNYSPSILTIDSAKVDIFKQNLIKWYNSVINEDFSNYEKVIV